MSDLIPNIGLEIHVQLNTLTKAFSGEKQVFGAVPNSLVSPISLALPGTLPRINEKQVHHAIKLGLACHCEINRKSAFDRKNYSYPDLPKSYQLTQDDEPICLGGYIDFYSKGQMNRIKLHHIHMEEDAGKSIHELYSQYSAIDLNRAGTALLEVVTEPEFSSAEQVHDFMEAFQIMLRHLDISDANMEEGSLRADLNISLRSSESDELGTRTEVKNVNSKKFAQQAIDFEIERQRKIIESGGDVEQQSRLFDPEKGITKLMRKKEDALDYRYFPDPDLCTINIDEETIKNIQLEIESLPVQIQQNLVTDYGISLEKAAIISRSKKYHSLFQELQQNGINPGTAVDLIVNHGPQLDLQEEGNTGMLADQLTQLSKLIDDGQLSASTAFKVLIPLLDGKKKMDIQQLAKSQNILIEGNGEDLQTHCRKIIDSFPGETKAYRSGKKNLIGFFMGQLMRQYPGGADPKMAKKLFEELLNKESD